MPRPSTFAKRREARAVRFRGGPKGPKPEGSGKVRGYQFRGKQKTVTRRLGSTEGSVQRRR